MRENEAKEVADLYIRTPISDDEASEINKQMQLIELNDFCIKENLEVGRIIYDRGSAKDFERTEWKNYQRDLEISQRDDKAKRYLLYTTPDRFSRNAKESIEMTDYLKTLGIVAKSINADAALLNYYLLIPENDRRLRRKIAKSPEK